MNRIAWIFRWACYRWYLTAPIQWRISCWALPYAGDYAYLKYEQFCEIRREERARK